MVYRMAMVSFWAAAVYADVKASILMDLHIIILLTLSTATCAFLSRRCQRHHPAPSTLVGIDINAQ